MPSRLSCSVMKSELVSTFAGVSISLPTAMIAARVSCEPTVRARSCQPRRQQTDESPHQKIAVDARHDVVEHDTEAAGQQLEPPRRPRLHDVEHPEDEEADDRAGDVDRMKRERDEHPDDFVDDDRPWIDSAEMMFGFGGAPQADDENHAQSRPSSTAVDA